MTTCSRIAAGREVRARYEHPYRQLPHRRIFDPFVKRRRVFAPSASAFVESGRTLALVAAREGWQLLNDNPSLLNDALIASSCRELGISLVTRDTDFKRFEPFLKGWRTIAPWPV